MRKQLGIFVASLFYYTGLVKLFRWRMGRSGKRVLILNYHHASRGNLRSHMLYFRRHYRVMHLEDALEWLYSSDTPQGHDARTALVLTFDDGYHDNYTHAFELARELHVPITIFVIPGYLDNDSYFWWCESGRIVRQAGVKELTVDDRLFHLDQHEDRVQLTRLIDGRLRTATSVAEREAFLHDMYEKLAAPASLAAEDLFDQPLTWGEALKMQESGWVSFGSHTMHHPVLACLTDPEEVRHEVSESRQRLQQRLGRDVRTFAYPIGKDQDISADAVEAVRAAGYSWAVTALEGTGSPQDDPLLLRRVLVEVSRHWLVVAAQTAGIWSYLAPLWKSVLGR